MDFKNIKVYLLPWNPSTGWIYSVYILVSQIKLFNSKCLLSLIWSDFKFQFVEDVQDIYSDV